MLTISQKCQYGLRAIFELARKPLGGPRKIGEIAEAQAIPPRFLESILNTLKQAGIVESRRGASGGYILAVPPAELTAGKVISILDGPLQPVKCIAIGGSDCPLRGKCTFLDMWQKAGSAMENVFESTTFQSLLDKDSVERPQPVADFEI